MSTLVSRIMLALLMLPLATVVYIFVSVTLWNWWGYTWENEAFVTTAVVSGGFVAAYWTLLWRRTVRWTPRRRWLTIAAFPAAAAAGLVLGLVADAIENELGAFVGGVSAILLWLVMTVLLWRETRSERIARVQASSRQAMVCPSCGYNLTGLRGTACPECGADYTLDELIALQPSREHGELEERN